MKIVHTASSPHYPSKNVFSDRRNVLYRKSASFRCDGRLFHSPGPAAANRRCCMSVSAVRTHVWRTIYVCNYSTEYIWWHLLKENLETSASERLLGCKQLSPEVLPRREFLNLLNPLNTFPVIVLVGSCKTDWDEETHLCLLDDDMHWCPFLGCVFNKLVSLVKVFIYLEKFCHP